MIAKLQEAGFVAYLAGGCVRDALLGNPPKDFDVATDATPTAVRQLFGRRRTLAFGAAFGVIGVLPERNVAGKTEPEMSSEPTEVATFRSDGDYSDGRRPDSVHYGNAEQDALRRDFTINGMFYDPSTHEVIDFVDGRADIQRGLLRTIGDAELRFEEDKLRMLRSVRFATTLQFRIDPPTLDAIQLHASSILAVSEERIGAELRRVLLAEKPMTGLQLLSDTGLDRFIWPGLDEIDFARAEAITGAAQGKAFPVKLACLLALVPEPLDRLASVSRRWRLSNEEVRIARAALEFWPVVANEASRRWSKLQPVLTSRDAGAIVDAAEVIVGSGIDVLKGVRAKREAVEHAKAAMLLPSHELDPAPLITGDDLKDFGVPPGPRYRDILQSIRDAQLDGEMTSRAQAIDWLRSHESQIDPGHE